MKKIIKILIVAITIITSLIVVSNKVIAEETRPSNLEVSKQGSGCITANNILGAGFNDDGNYLHDVCAHPKYSEEGTKKAYVYCLEMDKYSCEGNYHLADSQLESDIEKKIAGILESNNRTIYNDTINAKNYFTTSIAIWYFSNYGNTKYTDASLYNYIYNNNTNFHKDSTGKYVYYAPDATTTQKATANEIIGLMSQNYERVNPTIKINSSNNSFTLSSDGEYYVSSNISVTTTGAVGNYTVTLENAPEGTVITDESGNTNNVFATSAKFIVKVPTASISELSYQFNVKVNATGTINKAYLYVPDTATENNQPAGNPTYPCQGVVALYPVTLPVTDSIILGLNLDSEILISKQDATNGKELPGATLVIKNSNGEVVETWVSGSEPHPVSLEPGVYTLTETIAPKGYEISEETIEFTVKEDGTVDGNIVMKNEPEPKQVDTGDALIIIAWVVALSAIGYVIYYFLTRRKSKIKK